MPDFIKIGFVACPLWLCDIGQGSSGPFEDADAALKRGDYAAALDRMRKAAQGGNPEAQAGVYALYIMGMIQRSPDKGSIAIDQAEAIDWLRKAADQGHAPAQVSLGQAYRSGEGVPQDYVMAHMWFNLAAAKGEKTVREERERLEKKMPTNQIYEAQRLAWEWKPVK